MLNLNEFGIFCLSETKLSFIDQKSNEVQHELTEKQIDSDYFFRINQNIKPT